MEALRSKICRAAYAVREEARAVECGPAARRSVKIFRKKIK
jgi:hypothetical protein